MYYSIIFRFLEGYSIQQLHGVIGNRDDCGDYSTYQSIDKTLNAGGYEVPPETGVHPCGFVMKSIYNGKNNEIQIQSI